MTVQGSERVGGDGPAAPQRTTVQASPSVPARSEHIRRVHATDPPAWWCAGVFSPAPVRRVGIGHTHAPSGWAVHHCETCGEDLFIGYEVDPGIPSWDEVASRSLPASTEHFIYHHGDLVPVTLVEGGAVCSCCGSLIKWYVW